MRSVSSVCQRHRREEWEPACHMSAMSDRFRRASYALLRRLAFLLNTIGNNQKILSMAGI